MTWGKRLFDISLALMLAVIVLPVLGLLLVAMAILQGRPFFYAAERMKTPGQGFTLYKLRSLRPDPSDPESGVTGGDKASRVTPFGRFLRRSRLDELPQLWNVLRGDMSFVGPRPPMRRYVEDYPEIYRPVLRSRPGITGLATIAYHRHEERLLATCTSPEETDAVYRHRCIPQKARLDLIYQRRRSICMDLWLIGRTARKLLPKRAKA
ncbi:MAG: sugar transferase [Rhodobacteraceae bacterium]|nr:sugar transferase [Paracoccaceae bacterium]